MRRITALLAGIALLGACTDASTDPAQPELEGIVGLTSSDQRDLASLRAATARFHRIEAARMAGYDTQFPAGCFASDAGAMGFHYLNESEVGTLDVTRPQLVMYEPQQNGTMKLVGVEFIYPGAPTDTPPVLFGQSFGYNDVFQVWVLHVWAWRHNPSGIFADWNPAVSCEFATSVSLSAHH